MNRRFSRPAGRLVRAAEVLFWSLAAGCAHPAPPTAGRPEISDQTGSAGVEAIRREERLKVMQEYWLEHTAAAEPGRSVVPTAAPPLLYPAGNYGGVNFAAREAADSSLAEPIR